MVQAMVIPEYAEGKGDDHPDLQCVVEEDDTRKAPAQAAAQVVVDMREFRSQLPCILHRKGIHILPATIQVLLRVYGENVQHMLIYHNVIS